ncbi:MAG TPA: SLC13 family permease [Bacillota bacterium]|nr:SLC13 family permease [Bacillota bacterium]
MATQIIIILLIILMFTAMILEIAHPATVALTTLIIFFVLGFISPNEMLSVLSNEGVITLTLIFVITSVVERTNIIDRLLVRILDQSRSDKMALLRLLPSLMGVSAFFNNTPIVVMMVSSIQNWCRKRGFYASKFLLPISYATIFGGMFTLIGTSTNLIVHGWLLERDFTGFSFFELVPYTFLGAIFGLIYLMTIGYKFLPENDTAMDQRYDEDRQFLYEAIVHEGCNLIGKTVTSNEFKKLEGLYLIKIVRDDRTISPIRLEDQIRENDLLVFTGTLNSLSHLEAMDNLSIQTGEDITVNTLQTGETRLIEGVISHYSALVNYKIKNSNFRNKYNASIVAVHRMNERIEDNIGEIRLKPGDVLLILAGKDFERNVQRTDDFYVISDLPNTKTMNRRQSTIAITSFIAMILVVALGWLSMFEASLLVIGLYILLDLFDTNQVKQTIPFQVLLLIIASLGIGKIVETSGTSELIANSLIQLISEHFGTFGLLVSVYLITNILTEVITNTAAAVIVLPIAVDVATYINIEPTIIAVVVAVAASASFSTPIGYQTNLIVYGPGGYTFKDYFKVGLPLNLLFMLTTIFSVYLFA